MNYSEIQTLLADKADYLLNFKSQTFQEQQFYVPSPNWPNDIMSGLDRNNRVAEDEFL